MTFGQMWSFAFPALMWVLLVVAAVLCAVGFYKFVYFLSLGYGLAIAGIGVAMLIIFGINGVLDAWYIIADVLFIAYGLRLAGFLLFRELKSAAYRKTLSQATKEEKPMPIFVKATIWVFVSILYVMQVSPVYYAQANMLNGAFSYIAMATPLRIIGCIIMLIGLVVETIADLEKSAQKKTRPDMVAMKGLYKIVRCPNYFGEITFWTGVFLFGCTYLAGVWQWVIAVIGYVCIVYIMFNGAQRLEKRQIARYGNNEEYNTYANKTPIILPLVPIYHLQKKEKAAKKGE